MSSTAAGTPEPGVGLATSALWRPLPPSIAALRELALDLRWTWSHRADALWQRIDAELWQRTHNLWAILEDVPTARLAELATDEGFIAHLDEVVADRRAYLQSPGWFAETYGADALAGVAFFCMEFGLGDALPLYAGGLGILAGDFLKTASDLGVPVIGVGLLYQEGYFRQMIDEAGWQQDTYPYNEPAMMPVQPVPGSDGGRLHIVVSLPGRDLRLRVWRADVGGTTLYLLDSNDPLNSPVDRGITGKLYGSGTELRMLQELILGIGGWRLVEAVHPEIEICHLNEGHAAFAVLERARSLSTRQGISFEEALWATRAGNIFTTHTPVAAGFDHFPISLPGEYRHAVLGREADAIGLTALELTGGTVREPFNMAYLAMRGAFASFGVSQLHGGVSRRIFQPLFGRWPEREVPVAHVTNGVHMPTWDSPAADKIFTAAGGKDRWRHMADVLQPAIAEVDDDTLWEMRGKGRERLVHSVRRRLRRHLSVRGRPPATVALAENVLDPNVLTLGFARRFTAYKRPNLLLHDRARLERLLAESHRPVQLVIAGKAHPADAEGKRMIQEWVSFTEHPSLWHRVVFLEDYDIVLAQELVQGVDVWINTPRRPWEACGTSGMKVLVNGGINLSELDGWWAEAYAPDLGWAIGTTEQPDAATQDARDAEELYALLEQAVLPEFYDRDASGVPRAWLARLRRSMAVLTPRFSATRMVRDYIEQAYLPAARALRRRLADGTATAQALQRWEKRLRRGWKTLHIGPSEVIAESDGWTIRVPVYLGEIAGEDVKVELYADPEPSALAPPVALTRGAAIAGAVNGHTFEGRVVTTRPADDYTVRVVPYHPEARVPTELPLICWQR